MTAISGIPTTSKVCPISVYAGVQSIDIIGESVEQRLARGNHAQSINVNAEKIVIFFNNICRGAFDMQWVKILIIRVMQDI